MEANQFSTTTKLKGIATMVLGGASNSYNRDSVVAEEVTFNYDVRLNFDTSFTGKDLLRTTLRAGNFANSVFGNGNTALEVAFQEDFGANSGVDTVGINRLFYQFPVGENISATFGAKVRQDDMLAIWPSVYPSDTIIDSFTYAGARGAYSVNLGAGVGVWYKKDGFSISANYVSNEIASENATLCVGDALTATLQLGYAASNWGGAFAYTYSDSSATAAGFNANSIGLSGYWQPSDASWIPSISAGFGYNDVDTIFNIPGTSGESWSWMVGIQWADAFIKGMALGSAGQSAIGGFGTGGIWTDAGEDTLAYELWYKFQVTDNISVTPAFFWIQNDAGALGSLSGDDTFGGLIKITFKF